MNENVRPLSTIAAEVRRTWPKVSPYAKPYLDAMAQLNSINDTYYADSAESVVRYFISNAASYRGDDARRIKSELKAMLGEK